LSDLNSPERKNFTSLLVSKNGLYAMRVGDAEQLLALRIGFLIQLIKIVL